MTRIRSVPLALALVAATVAPAVLLSPPASAATTFTFYGQGWGHGVGMSQYGAYGMANAGKTYSQILSAYYPGTTLSTVSSPSTLRVGLLQNKTAIALGATFGPIVLRLNDPSTGKTIATIPKDKTWIIQFHADGHYWLRQANGNYTGGHGWGGPSNNLYAVFMKTHTIVSVPGTGHRYNVGYLEFNIYQPCGSTCHRGRLILTVGTNNYVYGIAEVPASWPMAALDAQAVAARTYGVYRADTSGQHRSGCNCALYASVYDQTYIGYDRIAGTDGARWKSASDATASKVVSSGGNPIAAFYSSSNGGYEQSDPHGIGGSQLAYLPDRCDPYDYNPGTSEYNTWTAANVSGDTIGSGVKSVKGVDIGSVTGFSNIVRFGSGRISSITVVGTKGSANLTGYEFRTAAGLKSSLVWINQNRQITGLIRTVYDADQCSPGYPTAVPVSSSEGRYQTFLNGNIYSDTLRGNTLYLAAGDILDEYVALGGVGSVLGWPTDPPTAITGGTRADFVSGRIYDSDATGAHETHGPVMDEYIDQGGAVGSLGFPTSDVQVSGDTESQTYQNGSISCVSGGSCTVSP
ncbi:MAG TPA: SpoIID/LytB domain-containing protein [Actinomycetota bacterium]|nr:SpoIID/LytB domain-containing protein [Actinomycetota bacterium]